MKDKEEKRGSLLNAGGIKLNKLMGQNFLISQDALKKIIEATELSPQDTVIEVGAGDGTLTFAIAEKAKLVLAVEKDGRFSSLLQKTVEERGIKNIIVINEDILKFKPERFAGELKNYKLIGNIPYYLTSRLLRKFLAEEELRPSEIILTVQKEVAERIVARPPHMNLLALSVQAYGQPQIIEKILASSFWPKPKVDSAIIKISRISNEFFKKLAQENTAAEKQKGVIAQNSRYRVKFTQKQNYNTETNLPKEVREKFFKLVKMAFSQKRKTLANSLSNFFGNKKNAEKALKSSKITPSARPEELNLEEWATLVSQLTTNNLQPPKN